MTLAMEPAKPRVRVKAVSRRTEEQISSDPTSSRQTDTAGTEVPQVPATTPPRKPLRPHCLNPGLCAGSGRDHCWSCRKQMVAA
jgi:hypothetical protein